MKDISRSSTDEYDARKLKKKHQMQTLYRKIEKEGIKIMPKTGLCPPPKIANKPQLQKKLTIKRYLAEFTQDTLKSNDHAESNTFS